MRIYVAGPYQKPDPVVNTRKAIEVAEALLDRGHLPYVPHMTLLWHLISPHEVAFWYDYDLKWLRCCDALYRIPGESVGADGEVAQARADGQPVYEEMREVPIGEDSSRHGNEDLCNLLAGFENFSRVCRARLRAGHEQYGNDWQTKDNLAEAQAEMHDLANYGFLHWMQVERKRQCA